MDTPLYLCGTAAAKEEADKALPRTTSRPAIEALPCDLDADGRCDWEDAFAALWDRGVRSIMVEGGAAVIASLLRRPELWDCVVVTVSPVCLFGAGLRLKGLEGLGEPAAQGRSNGPEAPTASWRCVRLGADFVFADLPAR